MRGIILAGGTGSRLFPITHGVSKQLLPVYDKPMIYYPLSTLMLAGITDIEIITTEREQPLFQGLLGDGSQFGVSLTYRVQPSADGLAQAFLLCEEHIGDDSVALVLGDNIFYGPGLGLSLEDLTDCRGATIFGYWVKDPRAYGVVEFDDAGQAISLEEKPLEPRSNYAIPGLYFYDNSVVERARSLRPSPRGELEVTDLNRLYLEDEALRVRLMPRGTAWLDTGTFDSLNDASNFIRTLEHRQGLKVGCPEEIAWRRGYLTDEDLLKRASSLAKSGYGLYLEELVARGRSGQ
ncbi:glucose-1-phosphate thymidylyltransferase RfbA [Zhihengliuella alba]|uniref:Glucose-1-phosphate thymidylyltransferase n=1 Tax=Zhihengliuella alba TaxID=547018 RepID=A0ABP7D364_9MICC